MNENPDYKWQVGQKVVCVNESFPREATKVCDALPVKDGIYTIRAVRKTCEDTALLLKEIINTREIYGREPGFWQQRFEPVR